MKRKAKRIELQSLPTDLYILLRNERVFKNSKNVGDFRITFNLSDHIRAFRYRGIEVWIYMVK